MPALEAWRTLERDVELAPGSPFDQPEYRFAASIEADRLTAVAEDASLRGTEAGETSDSCVLTAVLYASALFLAGIAAKIAQPRGARFAVILSVVMLALAVGLTLRPPVDIGCL